MYSHAIPGPHPARVPAYRLHRPSGRAVVRFGDKDIYLGTYNSPESRAAYDRAICEWLEQGRRVPQPASSKTITVNKVIVAYLRWADEHYRSADGPQSREPEMMRFAFRPLKHLYGDTPAEEFGPLKLQAVRRFLIEQDLVRSQINRRIRYIQ